MSLPNNLGRLSAGLTADASLNIGVGVTPSGTYKFEVGTTSKFTGVATFGKSSSGTIGAVGNMTQEVGTTASSLNNFSGFGFGYNGVNYYPAYIGYVVTGGGGNTKGELRFAVRDVTTDTVATTAFTIATTGAATFSSTVTATQYISANNISAPQLNLGSLLAQSYGVNNSWLSDNFYYNGGNKYLNTGYATALYIGNGDGSIQFATAPSGTGGAAATMTNRLTIANTGVATFSSNVILGNVADDGNKLQVNGSAFIKSGNSVYIGNNNNANYWGIQSAGTGATALTFQYNSGASLLSIASTGAATFSSSLQAGSSATNYAALQIHGASTSPSLTVGTAADVVFAMAAGQELAITANGTAPYGVNFQARNSLSGGGGSGTSYPIIFNPLGGNVGIGTTSPSQPLTVAGGELLTAGNSSWFRKTFEINVTTWSSVVTFAPQSNPQYVYGFINITAGAYVNGGAGNGVVTSRWYYSISNNIINVGVVGSDVTSGSPPSVRLIVSSNTIVVQVQSYATGNISFTSVFVDAMLGSGYVNGTYWVIT